MGTQAVVSLVIGSIVVLSVPALVWSAAVASLYRNVQIKIGRRFRAVAGRVAMSAR